MVERASPVIRETTASPPRPAVLTSPAATHPPPAFVELRADHVPAIADRIFIDHAIRDTSVRLDPESRRPDSPRRTPAHRDSLIVPGGLSMAGDDDPLERSPAQIGHLVASPRYIRRVLRLLGLRRDARFA